MNRRRLAVLLGVFFLALAVPSSILVYQAYRQLKWEAFYQHQRLARELTLRIDSGFRDLIAREEKRPISDYEFLNVAGSGSSAFLQRSPLSEFPRRPETPGLLGYFQVDAAGRLNTPLVPESNQPSLGIPADELQQRQQQEARIRGILDQNRLVGRSEADRVRPIEEESRSNSVAGEKTSPVLAESVGAGRESATGLRKQEAAESPRSLDFFSIDGDYGTAPVPATAEQLRELRLEDRYEVASGEAGGPPAEPARDDVAKRSRKEKVNLPQSLSAAVPLLEFSTIAGDETGTGGSAAAQQNIRIETFESVVEPMEFAELDSGQFVLFRRVWRDGERQVQGLLIDRDALIGELVTRAFLESSLASMSRLIVTYRGRVLQSLDPEYRGDYRPGAGQESGELLFQGRLVAPFDDIELIYALARVPVGAGGQVILWSSLVLALVLSGGCFMLFRLGLRQLALARQQQDFVSAVSHELKTPLTSIRMYGEMLREGWVDESKRRSYYDFIYHEAERLTRLINNVLQLARMSRNEQSPSLAATTVAEALAGLVPRLESQLEAAGFELQTDGDVEADAARIEIDQDGFLQIFINLVDNAVKFSAAAEARRVALTCRRLRDGAVCFSVRDFGPGIAPDQMKKIFTLFYRSENELTRETVGTGIGLALVQQLAQSMRAEVDVVNCEPGAEFRVRFPAID